MPYPQSDLDRVERVLAVLGSVWTRTYSGIDQVQSYAKIKASLETQTYQDMLEAVAAVSRFTVPLFHKDNWYVLTLKESEMNTVESTIRRFNEAGVLFDQSERFDASAARPYFRFIRPATLVAAPLILNRLTDASLTLTNNIDFQLPTDEQTIIFRENPFENPKVPIRPIYSNAELVDRELTLWVFRGDFDWQHVYKHFGYVLGLQLKSGSGYRDFVNAIFDAIVAGSPAASLDLAFSAAAGVPLVKEATETVEELVIDRGEMLIITDQHVYRFNANAVPLVAIGDVVHAGDPLTDALRIDELNAGEVPAGLKSLSLGKGFLLSCFYSDLVFEDRDVRLNIDPNHPSDYTFCSFPVGGFPADVEYFFDEMHTRGIAAAQQYAATPECDRDDRRHGTLAHLLDRRVNRPDEPVWANLPETINPLKFLVANVLRNNAYVVRIRAGALGGKKLGLYNVHHLRHLLPPATALFIVVELPDQADRVEYETVTDQITLSRAFNPVEDTVLTAQVSERLILRLVSSTCQ